MAISFLLTVAFEARECRWSAVFLFHCGGLYGKGLDILLLPFSRQNRCRLAPFNGSLIGRFIQRLYFSPLFPTVGHSLRNTAFECSNNLTCVQHSTPKNMGTPLPQFLEGTPKIKSRIPNPPPPTLTLPEFRLITVWAASCNDAER